MYNAVGVLRSRLDKADTVAFAMVGFVISLAALTFSLIESFGGYLIILAAVSATMWAIALLTNKRSVDTLNAPIVPTPNGPRNGQHALNLDNLPGAAYRYVQRDDGSGYFAFISGGAFEVFGVSPEEAMRDAETIMGLFHPEDRLELRAIMATAVQHRNSDWWCGRVTTGGRMKWITVTAKASELPTGEVCWDGIALDDTRRQQELVESKRFLDSVIDNLPDMVFIKDAEDLRFVFLNKAGEELLGFDRSELIGKNDHDFFPPEQAEYFVDRDRKVLEGRDVVTYGREPIDTKYRGQRLLHTKKIPLTDASGEPKFLVGISEDVTDRVHTEEALMESQHRLNAILNHTATPIFLHDHEGRVLMFNESALNMTGKGLEQVLGCFPEQFLTPERARVYRQAELEVKATGQSVEVEEVVPFPDGPRTFITIRFPLLDLQGQVYAVGTVSTDITEHKRIMDEVKQAKEEAESANFAKSLFLSRMSHELRTPLNAILGFAQLMEFEDLPDEQRETVGYIVSAGRHLLQLINEVLDISRIESGNFSVSMEPVQILEVVQDAVSMVRPLAEARSIKIIVGKIDEKLYFFADRQRLSQATINLLSNAVKYNCEGGTVEVTFHATDWKSVGRIHVLDTGVGIASENIDRLFVPFDRLGADATNVEGTGLGLSLSRRLVEAMRGEMGLVQSDENGSVFYIQLPMADQPEGMRQTEEEALNDNVWRPTFG